MARKVIWMPRAIDERRQIMQYWLDRNKSFQYPQKLNNTINKTIKIIQQYPDSGIAVDKENVRVIHIKNYLLFYKVEDLSIIILSLWDTRQDPSKLKI